MKLQIALDDITLEDALTLLEKVHDAVDIVEVGTPFIIQDGLKPVREIKKRYPHLQVLADTKIMDAGDLEAHMAFAAGADYVTVLGVTDILTVKACLEAAKPFNGTVVVDMICVEDLPKRVAELEAAGANALAVHTGVDQQAAGRTPMDDLKAMKASAKHSAIFVAGGINLSTVKDYQAAGAEVAIVGGGIANAADPAKEAHAIAAKIRS